MQISDAIPIQVQVRAKVAYLHHRIYDTYSRLVSSNILDLPDFHMLCMCVDIPSQGVWDIRKCIGTWDGCVFCVWAVLFVLDN